MPRNAAFEQWLRCHNYDPPRLTPQEELFLWSVFQAETEQPAPSIRETPTSAAPWDIRASADRATAGPGRQTPASPTPTADQMAIRGRAVVSAAAAGDGKKQRTFEIIAYTGEPMQLEWWDAPVVIDLEGLDAGDSRVPILDNHGPRPYSDESVRSYVIGQSASVTVEDGNIVLRGAIFDVTDAAKEIIALADAGFSWQASIGARALQRDFVAEGNTGNANGRTYEGPVYIARKTKLRETSVVAMGADAQTSVMVASQRLERGRNNMKVKAKAANFGEYCKGMGIDESKLGAKAKAALEAAYADEDNDEDKDADARTPRPNVVANAQTSAPALPVAQPVDIVGQFRTEMAREEGRMREIRDVTAGNPAATCEIVTADGKTTTVNIREHAIVAGWDRQRTSDTFQLAELRAGRGNPTPHWYSASQPEMSSAVLEAAALQLDDFGGLWDESRYDNDGVPNRIKRKTLGDLNARYPDKVQQAAHTKFKGRIGLQELLIAGAAANGGRGLPATIRDSGDLQLVLRAANWDIRAEGASAVSLQNVLANVMNKMLLAGYLFGENIYRLITAVRPTKDFKPTKSFNLTGDVIFKKTNASGQLQAAALTDEGFSNQIDTFGRIMSLPRQTIINDDTAAITQVPLLMGMGSLELVNDLVWDLWLQPGNWTDGNNFWYARNTGANQLGGAGIQSNLITGGSSALSSASLQTARQTFLKQTKPNGKPLGWDVEILLYPPELEQTADELMTGEYLIGTGQTSNSRQPNKNIWFNRFTRAMSRYLSNSNYTGYSTTAWWLLTNPQKAAAIELAFLNGQEQPTVQTAQADFDWLGILVRGFLDVGANMQNPRAGIKSNGA